MLDGLKGDIERHHLGQRRGMKLGIGVAFMDHFTAAHIHHHRRIGCGAGNRRDDKHRHEKYERLGDLPRTWFHVITCVCLVRRVFCPADLIPD